MTESVPEQVRSLFCLSQRTNSVCCAQYRKVHWKRLQPRLQIFLSFPFLFFSLASCNLQCHWFRLLVCESLQPETHEQAREILLLFAFVLFSSVWQATRKQARGRKSRLCVMRMHRQSFSRHSKDCALSGSSNVVVYVCFSCVVEFNSIRTTLARTSLATFG